MDTFITYATGTAAQWILGALLAFSIFEVIRHNRSFKPQPVLNKRVDRIGHSDKMHWTAPQGDGTEQGRDHLPSFPGIPPPDQASIDWFVISVYLLCAILCLGFWMMVVDVLVGVL